MLLDSPTRVRFEEGRIFGAIWGQAAARPRPASTSEEETESAIDTASHPKCHLLFHRSPAPVAGRRGLDYHYRTRTRTTTITIIVILYRH